MSSRERILGPVERHRELPSTNQLAALRAAEGAPEGLVVRADVQSAGRGRRERAWHSPEGGLWLSLLLRPPRLEGLSLAAGLAVARLARTLGVEAEVRWPNDVYARGRKLAGILAEGRWAGARVDHAILGIGLDVNLREGDFPPGLRDSATSLALELGRELDLEAVQEALLDEVDRVYATLLAEGFEGIRSALEAACGTLGRRVRVHTGAGEVEGVAEGLGDDGALVLEGGREFVSVERVEVLGA